jgi:hypothetical protein
VAWTEADRDALRAAVLRNETSVRFGDRVVTYRSLKELLEALALVEASLVEDAGVPRYRQHLGASSKGF